MLSPIDPSLILPYPPPRPLPTYPAPSHLIGRSPPVLAISEQPITQVSTPSPRRVPELAVLQCIAQPCSTYLRCDPLSPQIPSPPLLQPAVGIPRPPPPVSLSVSPVSALRTHVRNFPGPVQCGGSLPTSPTLKSEPPIPPSFKKIPETLVMTPSCPRILLSRSQLFCAFLRFSTTSGQSTSAASKTRCRYLKEVTVLSGLL